MAHLLAVQAQDARSARLAIRARTRGLTAAQVASDPALVSGWLMRGTLHLVRVEDYRWVHELTARTSTASNATRLRQLGVNNSNAGRALGVIERGLSADGPLTREQLADRIRGHGVHADGQAVPHLMMLAALRGLTVLQGDGRYALADAVLPRAPKRFDRPAALAELARRYLASHGPASGADIAGWSGLALRDVRIGLAAIADELSEAARGIYELAAQGPIPRRIPPRLLPAFDPYLIGWKDRSFAITPEAEKRVYPGGGVIRAAATNDGRAIATWRMRRKAGTVEVGLEPFPGEEPLPPALDKEAADIARFEELKSA